MHLVMMVVNKHGSLVYRKVMTQEQQFSENELIRLGSTFHSMHAISSNVTPQCLQDNSGQFGSPVLEGINEIVCDTFVLKCL